MTYDRIDRSQPAPCIVDVGTIINKQDMRRILSNFGAVHYRYTEDGTCLAEGEGYVVEVFCDPSQATLVANQTLYINIASFDAIELRRLKGEAQFDLLQDNRLLQLVPLSSPLHEQTEHAIELATLEAMVSDVFPSDLDMEGR